MSSGRSLGWSPRRAVLALNKSDRKTVAEHRGGGTGQERLFLYFVYILKISHILRTKEAPEFCLLTSWQQLVGGQVKSQPAALKNNRVAQIDVPLRTRAQFHANRRLRLATVLMKKNALGYF